MLPFGFWTVYKSSAMVCDSILHAKIHTWIKNRRFHTRR